MVLRRPSPALIAALVNGVVVLLLPVLARMLAASRYDSVVHPAGWSPARAALRFLLLTAVPMLPLAAIAAWRTWAHASRWRLGDRGLIAVGEATACGAVTALLVAFLAVPVVPSLPAALPGLVLVGLLGAVVGTAVGLLLYVIAVIVVAAAARAMRS